MELDFVRIECEIDVETPVELTSVLYNTLRSFEAQFKAVCCENVHKSCVSCADGIGCPYRTVFAQQLSPNPETVRLHQKPSLPFSLYVGGMGDKMLSHTVGLVIIGSAVNFVDVFHSALLRMIEAAVRPILPPSAYMLHFYSLDYLDVRHEIGPPASLSERVILLSGRHILQNTVHSEHIRLLLTSPLRLLSNGSIAHRFDFATFFCSQLRRCSSLCAYYGTGELELDYGYLSKAAQNVAVLEDEIHYTQPPWSRRPNWGGLTGTAECAGLVEPMSSLLLLGSYFSAGKGATFGSGCYNIEVL